MIWADESNFGLRDNANGNDTYLFGRGSGQDVIYDVDSTAGNTDTILVSGNLQPTDISVRSVTDVAGTHLVLSINGTNDSVSVKYWFNGARYKIEQVQFADGTIWDSAAIQTIANKSTGTYDYFSGTSGNDVISSNGTSGRSILYGGAGNDILNGQQGDIFKFTLGDGVDTVTVDNGNSRGIQYNFNTMVQIEYAYYQEQVRLGLGSLVLNYGNQGDAIHIEGFNPNDVYGSQVIDELQFSNRTFTWSELLDLGFDLHGTAGNDVMTGTNVTDRFYGGAGNDTLSGGAGNDSYTFNIGDGRDTIIDQDATAGNVDSIQFGADVQPSSVGVQRNGDNLVLSIGGADDNITLNGWFTGDENKIEKVQFADGTTWDVAAIEGILNPPPPANMITGSAASESIHGTTGSDYMQALGGDDYVYGGDGDDALYGGDGNDYLKGDAGSDAMTGGMGNDTYVVDAVGDMVTESLNEGTDTVKSSITYTLGENLENLTLIDTSAINGTGNDLNNSITGNAAANMLSAGGGNDYIYGGDGDDILQGGDGNDYLKGDAGSDAMTGGMGNDTYVVDAVGDTVTESLDEGADTVKSSITYTLGENLENLTLTDTLAINGTGNDLNNSITGNAAANMLSAGSGNDYIYGGDGDDILQGGDGNDYLRGDAGNNLLNGGAGTDTLTGNAGNELFIGGTGADTITTGTGSDVIAFNRGDGQDMIAASVGADDTISLGGGINYQSLTMRKSGNNLILDAGNSDQVTMQNWFAGAENHNVINLQIVLDNATYNASSIDPLLNKQVQRFDFAALAQGFDQALGVNPALSEWSLTDSLLSAHLAGSDTEALGGDLAYQYNLNGSLAGIGVAAAQAVLGDANFGVAPQLLKPLADLQSGVAQLG